ncbi:hypothetical protein ACF0H5_004578 [Mactra antiquata]
MDEKQRDILDRNSGLLIGNIVMTDEFLLLLKTENVLPDTMINDIQTKTTQLERNTTLLETLRLRGGDAYGKFRHVLYLTGHSLLADHLYGEDIDTKLLRAEEVFGKFPKIFKHVSDDAKSRLLKYLETKVKERAVTNAWLTAGSDRSDFLDAKKIVYESDKDCKIKLENKIKKLAQMREEILRLKEEIKQRDEELVMKGTEMSDMQKTFKHELAKQTKFNAANNSSILQLKDRFEQFNERVRIVNLAMQEFLHTENRDIDDDANNFKISYLERNVRKLIQVARTNIEKTSISMNEKEAVLNILRASSRHKHHTLSDVVQSFVEKQERAKLALAKEMEQLLELVREQKARTKIATRPKTDLKYLKAQMAMLREEVEHMKKKIEWKDAQITDLISESASNTRETKTVNSQQAVTSGVVFPRLSTSLITRDSPDSLKEMEKIYQQYDSLASKGHRRPRVRKGSLAEVNLERGRSPSPEIRSRRNSRLENSDLDLFNTQPQYRRSLTDIASSRHVNWSQSSLDTIEASRSSSSLNDVPEYDVTQSRKEMNSDALAYTQEGRRPSLAELITIYEGSREDKVVEENETVKTNTRLPVLQGR